MDSRNEECDVIRAKAELDITDAYMESYGAFKVSEIKRNCTGKLLDEKHCHSANKFYTT